MPSEQPREGTQVERCVTCGSPVEVVTSDEGTSCYRPAQPQPMGEGDDLAARLDARAEMWERKGGLGASIAAGAYRQAAEMARASTHPEQSARETNLRMNRWREHLGDDPLDGFGGRGPAEYHYMATHEPEGPGLTRFGNLLDEAADRLRASTHPEQWVSGDDREWLLWITSYVLNRHEFTDSAATDARAALTRIATAIKQPASPTPTEQGEARVERQDLERLRDVIDRFDDGVGMNHLYVESLDRIFNALEPAPEGEEEAS